MERSRRRVERGRGWIITVQAPPGTDKTWRWKRPESWDGEMTYFAQCYEKGNDASGIHTHFLVNFSKVKTSNSLAKLLIGCNPGSEVDVQQKHGKWSTAREYVMKQDETKITGRVPIEFGKIPRDLTSKEEKEEETNRVVEAIKEGGLKQVLEEKAEYLIKYPSGCKLVKEIAGERSRKRTISCTIVWGDAGTGKTTWVNQQAKRKWKDDEIYHFSKVGGSRETVWFNGYCGQKCLILDDISGRSLPYEYLIKITGNDPMDCEIKGGRESAVWEEVWITSNYNPTGWYTRVWEECEETRNAFFRRINRIIHVFKENNEVTWEVEKDDPVHKMRDNFRVEPNWKKTPAWIKEQEREDKENELMRENDHNTLEWNRAENEEEEVIRRSEIGIVDENITEPYTIPDSPGKGLYWGGGDGFKRMHSPTNEKWIERYNHKEAAFLAFCKKFNIERKYNGGAELEDEEIRAAVRDGRLKYNEKDWIALIEKGEDLYRSHGISEEEWTPEGGYHDLRHGSEVEDLYDIVRNWEGSGDSFYNHQWYEEEHIEEIE